MIVTARGRHRRAPTFLERIRRREALEASVLAGLRSHLMEPKLFEEFCEEFTREVNRLRMEHGAETIGRKRELEQIERELDKAIQAILDGVPGSQLKDKIGRLEDRKTELTALITADAEPAPLLHPNMAMIYRHRISKLHSQLMDENTKAEAIEVLRTLIDEVRLVAEESELVITLRGDLAAMLSYSADKKKPGPLSGFGLSQVSLVAGTRFHLNLRSRPSAIGGHFDYAMPFPALFPGLFATLA